MNNMKQNNKEGKKLSAESYMGIGIAKGIAIGAVIGMALLIAVDKLVIDIPTFLGLGIIAIGGGIGAGLGVYLQKKQGYKPKQRSELSAKEKMIIILIMAITAIILVYNYFD